MGIFSRKPKDYMTMQAQQADGGKVIVRVRVEDGFLTIDDRYDPRKVRAVGEVKQIPLNEIQGVTQSVGVFNHVTISTTTETVQLMGDTEALVAAIREARAA